MGLTGGYKSIKGEHVVQKCSSRPNDSNEPSYLLNCKITALGANVDTAVKSLGNAIPSKKVGECDMERGKTST